MRIYYTADLIVPDESDTDDCGDPCEPGHGYYIQRGWWDPDWCRTQVETSRDHVRADEYSPLAFHTRGEAWADPDEPGLIDWAVRTLIERIGLPENVDFSGTYYATESDIPDPVSGIEVMPAAHVEALYALHAAIGYRLEFIQRELRRGAHIGHLIG